MRPLNPRLEAMPRSGIRAILDLAQRPGIIHLEIGQPDFPTPKHIATAAACAVRAGHTGYTPNAGLPELRDALRGAPDPLRRSRR